MAIKSEPRVVIDTNLLVSRVLTPKSPVAELIRIIIENTHILVSQATIDELAEVLERIEVKGYISKDDRFGIITKYQKAAKWVPIIEKVQECRDPKDDKFLELAINGKAEYIITGDKDLLVLNPFREIKILSERDFVLELKSNC